MFHVQFTNGRERCLQKHTESIGTAASWSVTSKCDKRKQLTIRCAVTRVSGDSLHVIAISSSPLRLTLECRFSSTNVNR